MKRFHSQPSIPQGPKCSGIVAGSGGFDSHLLGEFDLYASDLENSLFVDAGGSRLVLTPDQPDEFVESFRQLAASPLLQSTAHE